MSERAARATSAEPAADLGEASAAPAPEKLMRVLALAGALSRTPAREALLARILDEAIALSGAERGLVILEPAAEAPRGDPAALRVQVARNLDREKVSEAYRKFSRGIVARVLAEERTLLLGEAGDDARFGERRSVRELKLRSVLCTPLRVEGRTRGVLYLDNRFRRAAFTAADAVLLEFLAVQAGSAIETQLVRERHEATILAFAQDREQQAAKLEALWDDYQSACQAAPAPAVRAHDPSGLVGDSLAMRRLRAALARVAASDEPALILGESGTGKELVARAIHERSARRGGPFVAVSCAALPEALLEAELFGHSKGAFTGADRERVGRVERAAGGTLFLDEVGELTAPAQAKLLRFLEERTFERVGETSSRAADVRVLAATNAPLEERVEEGAFREDLYYRLDVVRIEVPALRERRGDIPALVAHFLARLGRRDVTLAPEALAALQARPWPGNVRELRNAVESAVVALGPGERALAPRHLPSPGASGAAEAGADASAGWARFEAALVALVQQAAARGPQSTVWSEGHVRLERALVAAALEATGGNQVAAARLLGVNRATLRRKMAELGVR